MIYIFKETQYYQLMYLTTLELRVIKYIFFWISVTSIFKKNKVKQMLIDINMLIMAEKGIRRRISLSVYRYA